MKILEQNKHSCAISAEGISSMNRERNAGLPEPAPCRESEAAADEAFCLAHEKTYGRTGEDGEDHWGIWEAWGGLLSFMGLAGNS